MWVVALHDAADDLAISFGETTRRRRACKMDGYAIDNALRS